MENYRCRFVVKVPGHDETLEMFSKNSVHFPFKPGQTYFSKMSSFVNRFKDCREFTVEVYINDKRYGIEENYGVMKYIYRLGHHSLKREAWFSKWVDSGPKCGIPSVFC